MNIEHLKGNFEKRKRKSGLIYTLGMPAMDEQIWAAENRLSLDFHEQFKMFYRYYNGLTVKEPQLEIYPLERLVKEGNFMYFAMIDHRHQLCFECEQLNTASQWNIIHRDDNFVITLTFSSFWSNKIWAWIDKRRAIWKPYEEAKGSL